MRYYLIIQATLDNMQDFICQFAGRGLEPQACANGAGWCSFHDWQISAAELIEWRNNQPNETGLWLVLESGKVALMEPTGAETALTAEQLLLRLARLQKQDPTSQPLQAARPAPSSASLREQLPQLLAIAGMPDILGAAPLPTPEPEWQPPAPLTEIQELAGQLAPQPLSQPLALNPESGPLELFLLAWLAADYVSPLLRLPASLALEWPAVSAAELQQQDNHWLLSFEANGTPFGSWNALVDSWSYLRQQLPPDSPFELWLAPLALDPEDKQPPNPAAIQRYHCRYTPTTCWLEAAAPAQPAERLATALSFCRWVHTGGPLKLSSESDTELVTALAHKEDLTPQQDYLLHLEGDALTLEVSERYQRAFLARRLWLRWFADLWDFRQSLELERETDQAFDDLGDFSEWTKGLEYPRSETLLLAGASGNFWQAEPEALDPLSQQQRQEWISWWQALGFEAQADLIWEPAADVWLHLLSHPQHHCLLTLLLNRQGVQMECLSWFANGMRAFSSSVAELPAFDPEQVIRFDWPEGSLEQRMQGHLQQAAAYAQQHQTQRLPLPADLPSLLQLLDQNLQIMLAAT